jgi:6-phosphogluconolactonase (cycloisomerase 2 family)
MHANHRSHVALFGILALGAVGGGCGSDDDDDAARAGAGAGGAGRGGVASVAGTTSAGTANSGATGGHAGAATAGSATAGSATAGSAGSLAGAGNGGSATAGAASGGAFGGDADVGGTAGADGGGRAGAAGEGGDGGEGRTEVAYVSTLLGGLMQLSLAPTGEPSKLVKEPIDKGQTLIQVAVDVDERFVYAVNQDAGRIRVYPIGADGTLPTTATSSISLQTAAEPPVPISPITFALDPLGRFAYAGTLTDASVHVFDVDPVTGALTQTLPAFDLKSPPAYVAVDPSGHFLYETAGAENGIRAFRIDQDTGALTELGASPFSKTLVHAGALVLRPDGAFLFSSGNGLSAFAVQEGGGLKAVDGSPFTTDLSSDFFASNIAMDPLGKYVYATEFLQTQHVSGFEISPESGALTPVPGSPVAGRVPYSVAVDKAGRFVYTGGDDGSISAYAIKRSNGSLTKLDGSPFEQLGGLQAEIAFAFPR